VATASEAEAPTEVVEAEAIILPKGVGAVVLAVAIHHFWQEAPADSAAAGADNFLVPAVSAAGGRLRATAGSVAAVAESPTAVMAAGAVVVVCR
jgi:hypothetical protein